MKLWLNLKNLIKNLIKSLKISKILECAQHLHLLERDHIYKSCVGEFLRMLIDKILKLTLFLSYLKQSMQIQTFN